MRLLVVLTGLFFIRMELSIAQEVHSFEDWDKKATLLFQTTDHEKMPVAATELLSSFSRHEIAELLAKGDYPVLRLFGYKALVAVNPSFEVRGLLSLLLNSESITLYNDEFESLKKVDPKKLVVEFSSLLESHFSGKQEINLQFMLRACSDECIKLVFDRSAGQFLTATNLSFLVEESCRRNPNWDHSPDATSLREAIEQLRFVPGRPQITFISLFPFIQDVDAVRRQLEMRPATIRITGF
jgi:hypothetical protein